MLNVHVVEILVANLRAARTSRARDDYGRGEGTPRKLPKHFGNYVISVNIYAVGPKSDPSRLADAMRAAGFVSVKVQEVEGVWRGPAGEAYLKEMELLHRFIPPFAKLDDESRMKVRDAIRTIVDRDASNGVVEYRSGVLLAIGEKR